MAGKQRRDVSTRGIDRPIVVYPETFQSMANTIAIRRCIPREDVSEASILHALRLPALPEPTPAVEIVLALFREMPSPPASESGFH